MNKGAAVHLVKFKGCFGKNKNACWFNVGWQDVSLMINRTFSKVIQTGRNLCYRRNQFERNPWHTMKLGT